MKIFKPCCLNDHRVPSASSLSPADALSPPKEQHATNHKIKKKDPSNGNFPLLNVPFTFQTSLMLRWATTMPLCTAASISFQDRSSAYGLDSHSEAKDLPCNILGQVHWVHQQEKIHYTNRLNIFALEISRTCVPANRESHSVSNNQTSTKAPGRAPPADDLSSYPYTISVSTLKTRWECHHRRWLCQTNMDHWWKGQPCIAAVPRSDTVIKPLRLCHFGPESHSETVHQKKHPAKKK